MGIESSIEKKWKELKEDVAHIIHDIEERYDRAVHGVTNKVHKVEIDHGLRNATPPVPLPSVEVHPEDLSKLLKKPGNYSETIDVSGVPRHFILHVPKGYDASPSGAAVPLVVALHGFTQGAGEFQKVADFDKDADKHNAAVLYPDATKWLGLDMAQAWDTGNGLVPPLGHSDDIGFIKKAIQTAQVQIKVDRNRIDLLGVSNGGMEAYRAATEMSGTFAAVVDISGAMSGREKMPPHPISLMTVVGTKDQIVPPAGRTKEEEEAVIRKEFLQMAADKSSQNWKNFVGSNEGQNLGRFIIAKSQYAPTFKPVSYATDFWKKTDHIQGKATVTIDGDVKTEHYENSRTGVAVEQITLTGTDHALMWGVPRNFKMNDVAWAFLSAHPKYHANRHSDSATEKSQTK